MSLLSVLASCSLCVLAQTPPPAHSHGPIVHTLQQRKQILSAALKQFDQAVDLKDHAGPKARRLYRQALNGFDTLIREGVKNGHLYYDAANAHVRLGEIGRAIADYRRALRLLPGDQDVLRNLEFARSLCEIQIPPTPENAILHTILFWHFDTSRHSRIRVAVAAYTLFWLLLIARLFLRRRSVVLGWTAAAVVVVALACGLSAGWDTWALSHHREGVVITDGAVLRKGNGEGYQPQLQRPLPQGVELQILEGRKDVENHLWYHVELRDGKDGWLRANQTEVI